MRTRSLTPPRPPWLATVAALLLALSGTGACSPAPSGVSLKVGIYQNSPKVFWNGDGRPQGLFVDLVDAIARDEGWRVEYVRGTWNENLERLEGGRLDMVVDVTHSDERAARFDLNKIPVIESWLQAFSLRGTRVDRVRDLDGKRIAILKGAVQEEYLSQELRSRFKIDYTLLTYPDYAATAGALRNGQADVMIATRFFYFSELRGEDIVPRPVMLRPSPVYFAFPRGRDGDLIDAIDRHLSDMKNDPGSVYYRSLYRWLGEQPRRVVPRSVKWLITAVLGLLLLAVLFLIVLRREVSARTAAVLASEKQYRQIYEGIAEGIYRSTPDGRVLMANPALVRLLGCQSLDQLLALDIGREGFVNAAMRDEFKRRMERDGEVRDFVNTWRRRDGGELVVRENARAVRGAGGGIEYYEGTVEDITEHVRADLALLDEKNKLVQLFDHSLTVARAGTVQEMLDRTVRGLGDLRLFARIVMIIRDEHGRAEQLAHAGLSDQDLALVRDAPPVPPQLLGTLLDQRHRIANSYYLPFDGRRPRQLLTLTPPAGAPAAADWRPGDCLVVPLTAKSGMIGYLALLDPVDGKVPTMEAVRLLELYANQAATAVENLRLYDDLEASYYDTLLAFVAAMEAKDPYTKGHSENVQRYAVELARHLGLPADRVKLVDDSALLHDIGKLGVRESILVKPASLTEAEFEEVKQHPLTGGQMVSRIENLATSAPIIRAHHEHYGGGGYPGEMRG
ncbi:transporter substrate-binding domain-containing protein, partial [bacterium]|nr:transporter substrate-binding domain-containing protein [bacterium]